MKISCDIIRDLLPLYYDDVCSSDSRVMVEEHLACCDSCRAELQAMADTLLINKMEHNLKEADVVQKLSRRWKKGMKKSLLKGILITILATVLFVLILYIFMDFRLLPKPY